jgi:hypothetical protein
MASRLERWEREFRNDAEKDQLAVLRDHLRRLGLPDEPEKLLNGTILLMRACCAYATLDGQSYTKFLTMQKYHSTAAGDAKYALTFDLHSKAFARVLVSAKLETADLADLYGHPWSEYEICGYSCFWVSRTDGNPLSDEEIEQIEEQVTDDLRYDYSEDEIEFWFDDSTVKGVLLVTVVDIGFLDQDEEDDE